MNLLGQKFGSKSALKTYFNGICINIWLKKLNNKMTESAVIFPGDDQLTEFKAHDINSDLQEIVDMLLNKIGEPCRTIERLKIEGYKLEEIANDVSMTLRQVKERSADCRVKLIELLKLNGYGR
jgi:DNA-directed RNA polymerase specialized sigma24 family protein